MKILVVAPTPFFSDRGTHIRILEEALALERRGHEITLATYHIGRDLPQSLKTTIDVRRIRRWLFWYKKLEAGPDWQKIVLDLLLIKKTFFLARTKRPDIIHGHLHEGVLIGWLVQKALFWRKIKLVSDFHGSLTKEMVTHAYLKATGLLKVFRKIERIIDNMGDQAVASSWANTEEIKKIRRKHDVVTVLDGVSVARYAALPSRTELRKKYGVPADKVVITYAGALIANKGVEYLLRAIPRVLEKRAEAHFVIAGFPWNEVEHFFRGKLWLDRVTIITPLPYFNLPEILTLSDIGVDPKVPALTAQASGKMLQYMGAGLPVVCFDAPNNREYAAEGAEYVKEVSEEGIASALVRLIDNQAVREQKGRSNRVRAAEKFSWEKTAEQLEEIYRTP